MPVLANAAIIALFTNIAKTHPAILHNPPTANRFYTFDEDEFLNNSKNQLNQDTLILGLSISGRNLATWNYKDVGTAQQKLKYINVVCLGKYEPNNFAQEDTVAQACEQVLDDIASWTWQQANASNCSWPVIELMDVSNFAARRLKAPGVGSFAGAVMTISLRAYLKYTTANPLNAMTP